MKTLKITRRIALTTLMICLLTTGLLNAQIQFVGYVSQGEGIAGWNADGNGPEPYGLGHQVPAPGFTNQYYYGSSHDYITGDPDHACAHFLPGSTGFPQFEQALVNHGYTMNQVKMKYGLSSLGDDIEGIDWFFFNNYSYSNYYSIPFTFELDGQSLLAGSFDYANMYISTVSGNWQMETGYSPLQNIATGVIMIEIADAFLNDIDGKEIKTHFEATFGSTFSEPGRSGAYYNVLNGELTVGKPSLPFQGLADNHEGIAYWNSDGTGPEPQAAGPGASYYYSASHDYDGIDPDPEAAMCEVLEDGIGYFNFYLQLAYRGFEPEQVKIKSGLSSMDEKVEFEDWWFEGNYFVFNTYHNATKIEVNGEPCIGFVLDTLHYIQMATGWEVTSSPGVFYDMSQNSSLDVQMVAQSFLIDIGERQLGIQFELPLEHSSLNEGSRFGSIYEILSGGLNATYAKCTRIYEGDVSGHWMASCSPYIIEGDISVPFGESLIIDPGVWLKFKEPTPFKIWGQILSEGNENNTGEIVYTAVNPDIGWGHIEFPGTSVTNDSSKFTHCIFEYGWASGLDEYASGGAIAAKFFDKIEIDHCLFRYNTALNANAGTYPPSGGAIGLWGSSPSITNCTFYNNSAHYGGAIFSYQYSNPTIERCLFYNNTVINDGGAIDIYDHSMATINFCTFNNNSAGTDGTGEGGAVSLYLGSSMNLDNSILWGNMAPEGPQIGNFSANDTIIVKYCDVEGGEAGIGPNPFYIGNYDSTNIEIYPMFAQILADNYRLSMNSPCIDAGDPTIIDPNGTACDMGAIFYPAPGIPVAIEATEIYSNSFVANWEEAFGATKYYLDVASDIDFENMIYSGINVGNVTSYLVTNVFTVDAYYRVRAYNSYGLSDYSNVIYAFLVSSDESLSESKLSFVLAPNPITNNVNIMLKMTTASEMQIEIFNFLGQSVFSLTPGKQQQGLVSIPLNLSPLLPGSYICKVTTENSKYITKFIKY